MSSVVDQKLLVLVAGPAQDVARIAAALAQVDERLNLQTGKGISASDGTLTIRWQVGDISELQARVRGRPRKRG